MRMSAIDNTNPGTFVYNYLLDAWIYMDGGMTCSIPFEAIVEFLQSEPGTPLLVQHRHHEGRFLNSAGTVLRRRDDGINQRTSTPARKPYNEVWTAGASPYAQLANRSDQCAWLVVPIDNAPNFNYTGLRTIQYSSLLRSAWTGKRPKRVGLLCVCELSV